MSIAHCCHFNFKLLHFNLQHMNSKFIRLIMLLTDDEHNLQSLYLQLKMSE